MLDRSALFSLVCLSLVSSLHAGYLSPKDIERIKSHWYDYQCAAKQVGVPVEILPAIHYRESGLLDGWYSAKRHTVTRNVGGPFMLDLGGKEDFNERIRDYEIKVYKLYGGWGKAPRVNRSFKFAALVAAHELKTKRRGDYWDYETLADAVWGYNGRSSFTSREGNAYLWSNPENEDKLKVRVRFKGKMIEFEDERPGVMVIYEEILKLREQGKL